MRTLSGAHCVDRRIDILNNALVDTLLTADWLQVCFGTLFQSVFHEIIKHPTFTVSPNSDYWKNCIIGVHVNVVIVQSSDASLSFVAWIVYVLTT